MDVYLIGVNEPVKEYKCKIIAIVHRHNDIEDKLVAAPESMNFTKAEIESAVHFQEQYYSGFTEVLFDGADDDGEYFKLMKKIN